MDATRPPVVRLCCTGNAPIEGKSTPRASTGERREVRIRLLAHVEKMKKTARCAMAERIFWGPYGGHEANWKDQRPRWIRPYWKGPDIATILERQYRLTT